MDKSLQIRSDVRLSTELQVPIETMLDEMAMADIAKLANSGQYTGPELVSMKAFRKLELMKDYDMAGIVIRGKILKEIQDGRLYSEHPERFRTLKEAAQAYDISISMLSDILNWTEHLFPFIENVLGKNPEDIIQEIGLSNFRELTPALVAIVSGKPSKSKKAQAAVAAIIEDVDKTIDASGEDISPEDKRVMAFDSALGLGRGHNKDLRSALRPTDDIEGAILRRNGSRYFVAELDDDQHTMLLRLLNNHASISYADLEQDKPNTIPIVRRLLRTFGAA